MIFQKQSFKTNISNTISKTECHPRFSSMILCFFFLFGLDLLEDNNKNHTDQYIEVCNECLFYAMYDALHPNIMMFSRIFSYTKYLLLMICFLSILYSVWIFAPSAQQLKKLKAKKSDEKTKEDLEGKLIDILIYCISSFTIILLILFSRFQGIGENFFLSMFLFFLFILIYSIAQTIADFQLKINGISFFVLFLLFLKSMILRKYHIVDLSKKFIIKNISKVVFYTLIFIQISINQCFWEELFFIHVFAEKKQKFLIRSAFFLFLFIIIFIILRIRHLNNKIKIIRSYVRLDNCIS